MAESYKLPETDRVEMASLEEHVAGADMEKAISIKLATQDSAESSLRMVCLNAALFNSNRAEI